MRMNSNGGRIPCINPTCRRTAAQDKYPGSSSIICGKCWRSLPARMRARHKQLNRRSRTLFRLSRKTKYGDALRTPQWQRIEDRYDAAWARLNATMIKYFTASETPVGIEDFLKEIGIA
ncbi:hypothetical protein OIU34_02670 [Pararhizobium sp. BT-229]|uniref:hypothetical protein n=1 Tax=Pararhizobium sp. BT-229 TaxID=2986923 RepID=UPI0021F7858A|nr:hypothetical protein [Pararhizobium sp. BT-229]MCV9960792.1 hypothetical protein [Pararhizobium sp. BT-229]